MALENRELKNILIGGDFIMFINVLLSGISTIKLSMIL